MLQSKAGKDLEHDFSDFYDFYLKYIVSIKNLPILFPSRSSFYFFFLVIFIIVIITFILRIITESREDHKALERIPVLENCFLSKDEIINCQKRTLNEFHQASDKCYTKENVNKCIGIIIYFPHLINISLPNSNGITPFQRVCYRGNFKLIELMIAKGANVVQTTEFGENAFHMLINYYIRNPRHKNFHCLDLLFKNAKFTKKDINFFKQFILQARESENKHLEEWLASHSIC